MANRRAWRHVAPWLSAAALVSALPAQDPTLRRIRDVHITRRDVFSERQAADSWFYGLFNLLHVTTYRDVIATEMWYGAGDLVSEEKRAELERNLRRFGIFAAVDVSFVNTEEIDDDGHQIADLLVRTRDNFSLVANGNPRFVGGVGGFTLNVGELNLLGTGKRVSFNTTYNDNGEAAAGVGYVDEQLFGGWHRLAVAAGTTDEGNYASLDLSRPLQHLEDPWSYGSRIGTVDRLVNYFAGGQTVAAVPIARDYFSAYGERVFGDRHLRGRVGVDVEGEMVDYDSALGPAAGLIHVPGNTTQVRFGPYVGVDWNHEFLKLTGIDTFDFIEDVRLGFSARLGAGAVIRDEVGVGRQVQPSIDASFRAAARPLPGTYFTFAGAGSARWYQGENQGWRLTTAVHAYQTSLPAQTLAVSLAFDGAFDAQNLQPQFTLGEDNGLRGYPAREFAGDRIVRLNVEDRIDTGIDILSVDLGVVGFFDAGWVEGPLQNLSLNDAITSVGVGLRFGSSELFGGNVTRLDLAMPLDSVNGTDFGISLSFAVGQVFRFFGNSNELRRDF